MIRFLTDLVEQELGNRGVMATPGFKPPVDGLIAIPEGLLMRWKRDEAALPYHFTGLELDPIFLKKKEHPLRRKVVLQYPVMFTARGDYLLEKQYTAEGADYIRWALKIDPDYIPAQLLAREYGIKGKPLRLGQ